MLSVLHDCKTLHFKRLHFRYDFAYHHYIANTLCAAFSIVCLDMCGKAQRWLRGTTWPNKQGTSGNTVSPELCAQGPGLRGSARNDTLETTLKMCFFCKCCSVKAHSFRVNVTFIRKVDNNNHSDRACHVLFNWSIGRQDTPWARLLGLGGGDGTPVDVSGPVGFLQ